MNVKLKNLLFLLFVYCSLYASESNNLKKLTKSGSLSPINCQRQWTTLEDMTKIRNASDFTTPHVYQRSPLAATRKCHDMRQQKD